jgi:hypothetical protein
VGVLLYVCPYLIQSCLAEREGEREREKAMRTGGFLLAKLTCSISSRRFFPSS